MFSSSIPTPNPQSYFIVSLFFLRYMQRSNALVTVVSCYCNK